MSQCSTSIHSGGSYNNITGNNIVDYSGNGIVVDGSYNTISGNNLPVTHQKIVINGNSNITTRNIGGEDGNEGIFIESSSYNTIYGNNMTGNYFSGIEIHNGHNNTIYENYLANNGFGVHIGGRDYWAENNTFYHNNFVNNTKQVLIDNSSTYPNYWDNSKEGNHWDDYTGLDENGDGTGDTPYIIDENNRDDKPLIEPVIIPEYSLWILFILFFVVTLLAIILKKFIFHISSKRLTGINSGIRNFAQTIWKS